MYKLTKNKMSQLFIVILLSLCSFVCSVWILGLCILVMESRADASVRAAPSWSPGVTMSAVRLWGMEMLSARSDILNRERYGDVQGLRVIKQQRGSRRSPLHSHRRHKSLASGVWKRCHLEKCNVKTMSFQHFLQNFPSPSTGEQM